MIPLTDAQILSRRFNYGCCRIDYLDKWVEAKIHGDGKCAEENWRMFMFMSFAKEVVSTIPVEGEEHKCTDMELAVSIVKKADCFCDCPCEPKPPTNCDITPDETVTDLCSSLVEAVVISGFGTANGIYLPNGDTYPFNGTNYPYFMKVGGVPYEDQVRMLADGAWSVWEEGNVIARDPNNYTLTDPIGTPPFRPWLIPEWWDGAITDPIEPQPVVEQATVGDLCDQDPLEVLGLIVAQPEDGIYSIGCCDDEVVLYQLVDEVWLDYTMPDGYIVEIDDILYTAVDNVLYPLFPTMSIVLVGNPGVYELTSDAPLAIDGRVIRLQGLGPNGWYTMWVGTESVAPQTVNLGGLPFTSARVVYVLDNGCEYISDVTITPPVGECGEVVASITSQNNCETFSYLIDVTITSEEGWPLGDVQVSIGGSVVSSQPAQIGTTQLGPFLFGTTATVTITNSADPQCVYTVGTITPEGIAPTFQVFAAVDASFEEEAQEGVTYLIVSNNEGRPDGWGLHVGEIVLNGEFTVPVTNNTIVTESGEWWIVTPSGVQLLYAPVLLFQDENDGLWYVQTTIPNSSDYTPNAEVIVLAVVDGNPIIVWSGPATDLETPQLVTGVVPTPTSTIAFYANLGCAYEVPGPVETPEVFFIDVDCSEERQIIEYCYGNSQGIPPQGFTFTNGDSEQMVIRFIFPSPIVSGDGINFYDGPIGTNQVAVPSFGTDLSNLAPWTTDGDVFSVEFVSNSSGSCADGTVGPVYIEYGCDTGLTFGEFDRDFLVKCDEYIVAWNIDLYSIGDMGEAYIEYSTDGNEWISITGETPVEEGEIYSFSTPVGPVVLRFRSVDNPGLTYTVAFYDFTTDCPLEDNPCAPETGFKLDGIGDISDIPTNPVNGFIFLVVSNNDNLPSPFAVGDLISWSAITLSWIIDPPQPGLIYSDGNQFYTVFNTGAPPLEWFPPVIITPTGNIPNNYILSFVNYATWYEGRNLPISIEVRRPDGTWELVFTGTEDDLSSPLAIAISGSFLRARIIYNPETCGFSVPAQIQL
jgi:hypothetical protein